MANYIDDDGNEITRIQKWFGSVSLITLSVLSMLLIIGLWPDRILKADDNYESYYRTQLFHTRLVKIPSSDLDEQNKLWLRLNDKVKCTVAKADSNKITAKGTEVKIDTGKNKDSRNKDTAKKNFSQMTNQTAGLIHLNTLLLLLVALTGFLGNLIHVATSFTTFLGSGQFKRSWLSWYYVKPFIASALALVMYFVLCGGFLTVNNSPNNLNIYGVLTIAMLTGLFTDRATLKLKEVFEVLLKPKEDRSDPLLGTLKIQSISPAQLSRNGENTLIITGENLLREKLSFLLDDVPIEPKVTAKTATYKFTPSAAQLAKNALKLVIKNEKGTILEQRDLIVPPAPNPN